MKDIFDFLSVGEERARTAKELAQLLGWDEREVTRAIHNERAAGALICSSSKGYFLPETIHDIQKFVATMRSRQKQIAKAAAAAEALLNEMRQEGTRA